MLRFEAVCLTNRETCDRDRANKQCKKLAHARGTRADSLQASVCFAFLESNPCAIPLQFAIAGYHR